MIISFGKGTCFDSWKSLSNPGWCSALKSTQENNDEKSRTLFIGQVWSNEKLDRLSSRMTRPNTRMNIIIKYQNSTRKMLLNLYSSPSSGNLFEIRNEENRKI